MAKVPVCREDHVPPGSMKSFEVQGEKLVIYHLDDGFYATQARCTHVFANLAKGKLVNGNEVHCPLHRARFDVRNGEVREWACFPPGIQMLNVVRGEKALKTWPVTVEAGEVYVGFPD